MYAKMIDSTALASVISGFARPDYPRFSLSKPRWGVVGALAWIAFAGVVIANAGHPRVPPSGAATCHITHHPAALGPQAEAKMKVGSGVACPFRASFILDAVHSVSVVSGPQSGSLSVIDQRVVYKPNPKFKGRDSFAFAVQGILRSEPVSVTVNVAATVE